MSLLLNFRLSIVAFVERLLVVHPIKRLITVPVAAELVHVSGLDMKNRIRTFLLCMGRIDKKWCSYVAAGHNTSGLVPVLPLELDFLVLC